MMGEPVPPLLSCREAVRRLWDYLDGDAVEQEQVAGHLAVCRRCCGEVEFVAALREMLAAQGEDRDVGTAPLRRLERFVEGL